MFLFQTNVDSKFQNEGPFHFAESSSFEGRRKNGVLVSFKANQNFERTSPRPRNFL